MSETNNLKIFKRKSRYYIKRALFSGEYKRLEPIKGSYKGKRCFLVAGGPSVSQQEVDKLSDEFVCVVNGAINGVGKVIPHATMHVVQDLNRYRRFATEFERAAIQHGVEHRFFNFASRKHWYRLKQKGPKPYFNLNHPTLFENRGMPEGFMRDGISTGYTVLIAAAQILSWMGFTEIYVIGCDLSYDSAPVPYFYEMNTLDQTHENDANVQKRRGNTPKMNNDFGIAAKELERVGTQIFNAGHGGNLTSLERVNFDSLFV